MCKLVWWSFANRCPVRRWFRSRPKPNKLLLLLANRQSFPSLTTLFSFLFSHFEQLQNSTLAKIIRARPFFFFYFFPFFFFSSFSFWHRHLLYPPLCLLLLPWLLVLSVDILYLSHFLPDPECRPWKQFLPWTTTPSPHRQETYNHRIFDHLIWKILIGTKTRVKGCQIRDLFVAHSQITTNYLWPKNQPR